jgi:hypothetical protein
MTWSVDTAWKHVLQIISRAESVGVVATPAGARAIGHIPFIGPLAYLHTVYPPLGPDGLAAVEAEVRRPLPEQYRELLMRTNGLNLFRSSLCVYGLRTSYARTTGERLPFSGDLANTVERPPAVPNGAVIVGSYRQDGSHVFVDENGAARCDRNSGSVLNRWACLAEWLVLEADRMAAVYVLPTQPASAA